MRNPALKGNGVATEGDLGVYIKYPVNQTFFALGGNIA